VAVNQETLDQVAVNQETLDQVAVNQETLDQVAGNQVTIEPTNTIPLPYLTMFGYPNMFGYSNMFEFPNPNPSVLENSSQSQTVPINQHLYQLEITALNGFYHFQKFNIMRKYNIE
jgi:hypothetical protein